MRLRGIKAFIELEAFSGILLFFCAIAALIVSNSPLAHSYHTLLELPVLIQFGDATLSKHLIHWVNEGLMAIFFLLVGLEIKREMLVGELNSMAKFSLPAIGALGGMLVPALVFLLVTFQHPELRAGWAIPAATDIAFALGIISLLGKRVPTALKTFLTALAILDDLCAILIIALFYTGQIHTLPLLLAGFCLIALFVLNRMNITARTAYWLVGAILWLCVLESGLHATLAGVAVALAVPLHDNTNPRFSPLTKMENKLHPWVAYLILPAFAFTNAGISFKNLSLSSIISPLPLGIMLGLFVGKQLGIFGSCYLAIKAKITRLPQNVSLQALYGCSLLCGVGFTMSLFIGTLAFEGASSNYPDWVRLGVMVGSLLAGLGGWLILHYCYPIKEKKV